MINKIREKYLSLPEFTPEKIKSSSSAAEGLCRWVRAISNYEMVARVVNPKKKKLVKWEENLEIARGSLITKRKQLKMVKDKVNEMNSVMQKYKNEKKILEDEIALSKKRLDRAEILIRDLGGEKNRWSLEAENSLIDFNNILGDSLMSSGIISYTGSFTSKYRQVNIFNLNSI